VDRVPLNEALQHRDAVLRAFLDGSGRLRQIPSRPAKRLVILDLLAQEFEPGERYDEAEVNRRLKAFHDDVAALRRNLVDEGFLDRAAGIYWRSGGTVSDSAFEAAEFEDAPPSGEGSAGGGA